MPNSVVLLTVQRDRIDATVQLPLSELQFAFGHAVNDSSARLITRFGPQLSAYLRQHIRAVGPGGQPWSVGIGALSVDSSTNSINGTYRELVAHCWLKPPSGADLRQFTLYYDAIVHQVITHKILVSVRQDWASGALADESPVQIGLIELDIPSGTVPPLAVRLKPGTLYTGFQTMVELGVQHIAEGTDHLLFLLVLLLPAPLRAGRQRWHPDGGVRYSLIRLLRLTMAFTLGHSLTLLAGTVGWLRVPAQPVEVLIAGSILVSAIHALRPLFPGREGYVAAGFGLIHGLAFADTLSNLSLDPSHLALSLLGFNLGIECTQVFVIGLVMPWLIVLSRSMVYTRVRLSGALFASVAALAWIAERLSGQTNWLTTAVETLARYAPLWLLLLIVTTLLVYYRQRQSQPVS
ncbi:HupE/UreJ family protein [Spirosoma sordidisoli]|uniref:HupE/UreJ family protein n=1 Tax=Spirosoma sordidisoli TaxID=2502893 RepID=A0A4Q2UNT9_9BACT|nr:HupE/UreJ family protein [Spirosoma sordidisoli]RYC69270.1 HupE/UreJ family protein [Spirosoma sordidisoli]